MEKRSKVRGEIIKCYLFKMIDKEEFLSKNINQRLYDEVNEHGL